MGERDIKGLMLRVFFTLMVLMSLALAACDAPDSQSERPTEERRAANAAQDEQLTPKPAADTGDEQAVEPARHDTQSSPSAASDQYSTGPSPEDVLASQYQYINAGDYEGAYELFDSGSLQIVSEEQYGAYFASVAPYHIKSYSFPSVQVQGDVASLVVDLAASSSEGENQYRVTQRMVREAGSWRVVMREEQVASFAEAGNSSESASATASASALASTASGGPCSDYDARVTVSRVVDGDTIEILPAVDGNEEVRLIGMDTPEIKDPSEGIEPLGPEASAFAADELTGRSVGLVFDVEMEDYYGRLLAYVCVGGEMFNEVLLEEGYAQAYPYEPNTKYEARFAAAQEEARAAGLRIWGLPLAQQCQLADRGNGIGEGTPGCEGATASATATASPSASASASASPGAGSSGGGGGGGGGRKRGAPAGAGGDIDCDQVNGPIPTPPGDPDNLDGDGDGLACE